MGAVTQTCTGGTSASGSGAFTMANTTGGWSGNVSASDLMVVAITYNANPTGSAPTTITVTDDDPAGSNTYTAAVTGGNQSGSEGNPKNALMLFTAPIATGGRKPIITVHIPAAGAGATYSAGRFSAFTASGISATVDVSATGTANAASGDAFCPTGTTGTATAAGEFGVAIACDDGDDLTITAGSAAGTIGNAGFTKNTSLSTDGDGGDADLCVAINTNVSNGVTTGGNFIYSSTGDNYAALVAVFKLSSVTFSGSTAAISVAAPAGIVTADVLGAVAGVTVAAPIGAATVDVLGATAGIAVAALMGGVVISPSMPPAGVSVAAPLGSVSVGVAGQAAGVSVGAPLGGVSVDVLGRMAAILVAAPMGSVSRPTSFTDYSGGQVSGTPAGGLTATSTATGLVSAVVAEGE